MRRSLQTPPTVQQLLHRLGWRISELPESGDLDFLAACGIATLTFGRFLDFERSKSWKRNRLALAAALMILFACYDLTEIGRRALLRWPEMISPPDLEYPVIGVSRPIIASRSTESEPG
jgi:hypothetical protein